MARHTVSGEKHDVLGLILGIIVVFALGVFALKSGKHESHEDHFFLFGAPSSQVEQPVLPRVTRPSGQ
jgi:hypothetical protein